MNPRSNLSVVIKDLFQQQLKWTVPFIILMLVINTFKVGHAYIKRTSVDDFYSTLLIAGNIYMFVIGILGIYFLSYLVEHGIPRKDYFKGAAVVAICLSIAISIVTWVLYKVQRLVLANVVTFKESQINEVVTDIDGTTSLFDDIIVAAVTSPYIDPEKQLGLALTIFAINLLFYYSAGWLIGAAFQHTAVVGLSVIAIVGGIIAIQDTLLRVFLEIPVLPRFEIFSSISKFTALMIVLILITALMLAIKQLTKKVVVKI